MYFLLKITYIGIIIEFAFCLSLGFIEVAFTQDFYVIPNAPINDSCEREEHSLPLPAAIQLQLNKPASVVIAVNVTVKGEDTQCKLCFDSFR